VTVCLSGLPVCDIGLLWPNGWMDQDATRYGGRPHPWTHCARWGPSPKGAQHLHPPPEFLAHVCCGQAAGWIKMPFGREINLSPGNNVLDGDPTPPSKKEAQHPQLWPMYCSQTAGWIKMPFGMEVDLGPGHIVLDGAQLHPGMGHSSPTLFGRCLLWPNGRPSQLLLSSCWKSSATTDCKRGLVYLSFDSLLEARDKHFHLHC